MIKIVDHLGTVVGDGHAYNVELNVIKRPDSKYIYDLRRWNSEHTMYFDGLTVSQDELFDLVRVINNYLKELDP